MGITLKEMLTNPMLMLPDQVGLHGVNPMVSSFLPLFTSTG
jgi:hypothetical protein